MSNTDELDRLRAGFAHQGPYRRPRRLLRRLAILAALAAVITWSI